MQWRDVVGHEGLYQVSSAGEVRSVDRLVAHGRINALFERRLKGRLLKTTKLNDGYLVVDLCKGGKARRFLVHRLVLEAFIGPCPDGMEACHFPDDNPENNQLNNLRWDTRSGNRQDSIKNGTWLKGSNHPNAKLTDKQVKEIRASTETHQVLADRFGVGRPTITKIKNNQRYV